MDKSPTKQMSFAAKCLAAASLKAQLLELEGVSDESQLIAWQVTTTLKLAESVCESAQPQQSSTVHLPPEYRAIIGLGRLSKTKRQRATGLEAAMKRKLGQLAKLREQAKARLDEKRDEAERLESLAKALNESNDKHLSALISATCAKLRDEIK